MRVVIRSQTRSLATRSDCRVRPVGRKSGLRFVLSAPQRSRVVIGRRVGTFGPGKAVRNANLGMPFLTDALADPPAPVAREEGAEHGHSNMNDESRSPAQGTRPDRTGFVRGSGCAVAFTFGDSDAGEIFREATAAVGGLASCQVEASYRSVNGGFVRFPPSQPAHPDIQRHRESGWDGHVDTRDGRWGWAFPLSHRSIVNGCLVVSAASAPSENQIQLLTILAQQTGAALAHAALHDRDSGDTAKLTKSNADLKAANRELGTTVTRLQRQTNVHEVLSAAVAAGKGEQGIADALYDLTGHSVGIEDRFGNLRCWAGPGQPHPYPKQLTDERELLLHELAAQTGQARIGGRVLTLVQPRAEILGVLALNDPDDTVTEDDLFALRYGSIVWRWSFPTSEPSLRSNSICAAILSTICWPAPTGTGPTLVPTPWAMTYDGPTMWWWCKVPVAPRARRQSPPGGPRPRCI